MTRPLIALVLLVLPTAALAAGGGVGQPEGWYVDLAFHAFNLVLFVGLIVYLARGVITEALKNRSAGIAKDIEESNRLRREAQDRCDAFDARLNRFEVEFDEMRAEASRTSEREANLISERASQEVAQIKDGAEKAIRDEVTAARAALHRQAVELAMQGAEEHLRGQINSDDQERLAQELLGSMQMKEVNGHG